MKLYDYLSSGNGYKIRLVLNRLGIRYERVEVDILKGESRTPEFLARNPNGRIPVLELADGRVLAESNAIIAWLAEGSELLPNDRWLRAKLFEWLFFEQYSHEPNIATVRFWLTHSGLTDERRAMLEGKRRQGYAALGVMEGRLDEAPFLVADRFTIADIALYAYTHVAEEGGFDLAGFPAVRDWLARVAAEPGHIPITRG
jgi:glutathione S-transferase